MAQRTRIHTSSPIPWADVRAKAIWTGLVTVVMFLSGCYAPVSLDEGAKAPALPPLAETVSEDTSSGGDANEPDAGYRCFITSAREYHGVQREYRPPEEGDAYDESDGDGMSASPPDNDTSSGPGDRIVMDIGDQDHVRFVINATHSKGFDRIDSIGFLHGDGLKIIKGAKVKHAPFSEDESIVMEVTLEATESGEVGVAGSRAERDWNLTPCARVSYYINPEQ